MNEEYIDNVKHLIEQKDADKVKELLVDLHPADIAELCDDLNPEEALAQINSKGYSIPYQVGDWKIIKVGVNFDSATRTIGTWKTER